MDAKRPVLRITIKELILELEDEHVVQSLGRSLGSLLSQPGIEAEPVADEAAKPRRRGRKPKVIAALPEPKGRRQRRPRAESATAQIVRLRNEGFFAEPRRASEVRSALRDRGHDLENRQIYATLKYMADSDKLSRVKEGDDGNWMYRANPA